MKSGGIEYLKNKICKLTPLFDIDYSKKTNFISTCLFDMKKDAYRSFDKYLEGIGTFRRIIKEVIPDWKLRIFIDDTILENKELMKELKSPKNSHIQLIKFSCPNYLMNDKSGRHKGVFGTLLRLFPFFDLPNNDAGIVVCDDLDWEYHFYSPIFTNKINVLQNIVKNNSLEDKKFNICLMVNNQYYEKSKKTVDWVLMAYFISYFQTLDVKLLYDFFTFLDKKDTLIYVEHYMTNVKDFIEKNKNNEIGRKFTYGLDEYFLKYFVIDKITDNIIKIKRYNFVNFIDTESVVRFRHNVDEVDGFYEGGSGDKNSINSPLDSLKEFRKTSFDKQEILHDKYTRYLLSDVIKDGFVYINYHILYTIIQDLLYNKYEFGKIQPIIQKKLITKEYLEKTTTLHNDDIIDLIDKGILRKFFIKFFSLMIHIKNSKKYNNIFTPLRVKHILKKDNLGVVRREYFDSIIDGKHKLFNFYLKKLDDKDIQNLLILKREKFIIKELL